MMSILRTLLLVVAFLQRGELVASYSNGAGACAKGSANVGDTHTSGTVTTGTLADGGYTMKIGGVEVANGGTILPTSNDFTIVVAGASFKGVLIRVDGTGTSQVTTSTADLKSASGSPSNCRVGAITHSSNSAKTTANAIVSLPKADNHQVDVTVVVTNSGSVSTYYHSTFFINGKVKSK